MKLRYKLFLSVFGILVIIGVVGALAMRNLQQESTIRYFEKSVTSLSNVIIESLEHQMLLLNAPSEGQKHIQDIVNRITSQHPIKRISIVSNTGKVYASDILSDVDTVREDELVNLVLTLGQKATRTNEHNGRTDEISFVFPIMNKTQCTVCHGSQRVLGAIEIGLTKDVLSSQLEEQGLIMFVIGGLTFIALYVTLSFILDSQVVTPLSSLTEATRKIGQGDFSTRINSPGKDEVGQVSSTFNEMASRIQEYAKSLEETNKQLEQRVERRTKQVQELATIRGQLIDRLISAQEQERQRIARELHDEAGQALTMIMLTLSQTNDVLPANSAKAKQQLMNSRFIAEQTLGELRKLIYELRPDVLDQLGLIPALRSYIKSRLEPEKIKARLSVIGLEERLPAKLEITLFRIIQEAITNIIRHSDASRVNFTLSQKNSSITVKIEDNGKGFDVQSALRSNDSWGLRGIRERVSTIGGELNIKSKAGQGTRLLVKVSVELK
jgi:signal transduction histidine kinase